MKQPISIFAASLLSMLFGFSLHAQTFQDSIYGIPALESQDGIHIVESHDDKYVVLRYNSPGLTKIDTNGTVIWNYDYLPGINDPSYRNYYARAMTRLQNQSYIIAVERTDTITSLPGTILVRVDSNGVYQGSITTSGHIFNLEATSDGGFAAAGELFSFSPQPFLAKYSANYTQQWTASYPQYPFHLALDVKEMPNGDYCIFNYSFNSSSDSSMVLRVNPLGAQIWARNLVDFGARSLWALDIYMGDLMEVAADSNLVVLGRNQFTPIHPRLVKLDAQGGLIWSKLVTTPSGFSTAYSIVRSPDDGFVLAGASTSKGAIMAVDALGDTLWNQLVDYGPGSEYFLDLMVTSDCRIVACGNYVTSGSQLQVYVARSSTGLYPPQPGFTTTASGATYNFSATSSGYVLAWDWDFGDGNSSTLQNPSHAYAAAGTYQVCLTVSGACGTETICDSVRVTCQFPFSWFGFSGTHFTTNFNDQSTSGGTILSWFWDFGDGTTSSLQNPTHTYPANGTYLVCLTVTDSCGSATHCDSVQITCTVPTALFSSTSSLLNVNFTDQSSSATGIQSWTWDFGDGAGSSLQNPSHAYAAAGTYQVCLTVEDDCDSSSYCDSVPVSVPVGIEEINEGDIALVPNPACNMASLRLPLPITGDLEIDLYAPNGPRLKTQVLPAGSQTINLDLRDLASGIYLLGLKEDGQYIAFRKLAVRR